MGYGTLDLKLIGAKAVNHVTHISKMKVYAVVTISGGDPRASQRTPADTEGGTSPTWNFPMKFTVDEAAAEQDRLTLVVTLRTERALGDRDVGEVRVPIKELIGGNKGIQFVKYQVIQPSGGSQGELNFSYQFSEKMEAHKVTAKSDEPVIANPDVAPIAAGSSSAAYPPPTASGYPPSGYPPQQPGYGYPPQQPQPEYAYPPQQPGYGYPPEQPGYGYPPQQPGYGYPPQQPGYRPPGEQGPKNKFGGGGMVLGLLGVAAERLGIADTMKPDVGSSDGADVEFL